MNAYLQEAPNRLLRPGWVAIEPSLQEFVEAVLSLAIARDELKRGRLTTDDVYDRASRHLEVAVDHLVAREGLSLDPYQLRIAPNGRRIMFATSGRVILCFTRGMGPKMARLLTRAMRTSSPSAQVNESSMIVVMSLVDFCRMVVRYHKERHAF